VKERKPITEYFKYQGRFKHLKEEEVEFIQERVDEDYEILLKKFYIRKACPLSCEQA